MPKKSTRKAATTKARAPEREPRRVVVTYHPQAVRDLAELEHADQVAVWKVVDMLSQIGPSITKPHSASVKTVKKLCELRPGGGKVLRRPLYIRWAAMEYVILVIAPEAEVHPSGFSSAIERAKRIAADDYGIEL